MPADLSNSLTYSRVTCAILLDHMISTHRLSNVGLTCTRCGHAHYWHKEYVGWCEHTMPDCACIGFRGVDTSSSIPHG